MDFLSSYDPHERYRQRSFARFKSGMGMAIFLMCVFALGYWLGSVGAGQSIAVLQEQVIQGDQRQHALEQALTEAGASAQSAVLRYEALESSVSRVISDEEMEGLIILLRKQIDRGVNPDRLSSALRSARPPQNCSGEDVKKFVVVTPSYQGPESDLRIAEGQIVISARGVAAVNDSGESEAWFDPSKAVDIDFLNPLGALEQKSGVLPLYQSLVVGDREYRISLEAGDQSFIKVKYDSCDYP